MASVTLSSIDLRYPSGALGLADVDLHIEDGEFVALLGPSGSGKTTLLRTVAGFLAPTSGTVRIGDRTVAGPGAFVAPEHRALGMVFQQHAVWPHWSVGRNVEYPLRLAKVPRAERAERVARTLELVGLGGHAARDPATLSGGQRQRVALARALVAEPSVLLLDEALSALDEPLRDRLRLELQALTRTFGLTVLHVTHDRDEALALADRVVVLDGGRIQQVGTPPELVSRPASPFVARFVSDATIVSGIVGSQGFRAAGHPLRVEGGAIDVVGTGWNGAASGGAASTSTASNSTATGGAIRGDVELAILPEDVDLEPVDVGAGDGGAGDGGTDDGGGGAVVTSSLFGREGNDVVLDWNGLVLRSRTRGHRPVVGERVGVRVRRALAYPGASPAPIPASAGRETRSVSA